MPLLPDTFGWYEHIVLDSRKCLAVVEIAPCVNVFSARKLHKMVRKLGPDVMYEELDIKWPDDTRYSNGAWEILVVDRRYHFVSRVIRIHEDGEPWPLLIPGTCRSTAEEIARSIGRSLEEALTSGSQGEDPIKFKLVDGTELEYSPTHLEECLKGQEFRLSDGTILPDLMVFPTGTYVADRRALMIQLP